MSGDSSAADGLSARSVRRDRRSAYPREKVFQEIKRNLQTIIARGANVADRRNLGREGRFCVLQRRCIVWLTTQGSFSFHATQWDRRDTAEDDARIDDLLPVHSPNRRETNFRNRLSFARAYFAKVMRQAVCISGQTDRAQQLAAMHLHLLVCSVKFEIRNPPGPGLGNEF